MVWTIWFGHNSQNLSLKKAKEICCRLVLLFKIPVSLLAEDELVRTQLRTLDVPVQVTQHLNPIQVLPARTLSSMYQQLGKNNRSAWFSMYWCQIANNIEDTSILLHQPDSTTTATILIWFLKRITFLQLDGPWIASASLDGLVYQDMVTC